MERYQKGSLQKTKRKNGTVVWTFRWRETAGDSRIRRKKVVGTVEQYPTRKAAEQAVSSLRATINAEVVSPQTVIDLVAHYQAHELQRKPTNFSARRSQPQKRNRFACKSTSCRNGVTTV